MPPATAAHGSSYSRPKPRAPSLRQPTWGAVLPALAHGCQPHTRRERLALPQDRHQPTLAQPGDDLAGARAMLAQAGQHPAFDFVPWGLPGRLTTRRAQRAHHPIGAYDQGRRGQLGRQRLRRRQVALRERMQVLLEGLQRLLTRRWQPSPHRLWTDKAPTVPAQQAGCSRQRHTDRQGTAQRLERPPAPLRRLYAQGLIHGGHLGRLTPLGTPSDPSPPLDGPKEAGHLALGKAFTAQACPTLRAAGPGCWVLAPCSQHGFDEVAGEHAGHLPRCQASRGQGGGGVDGAQETLHSGGIVV